MPLPYRGTRVYFDGKHYSIPALSVIDFEENLEKLTAPFKIEELGDRFRTLVPVIGLAVRRNYPEVTDDYLIGKLDMDTFKECLAAVQGNSGLREVEPGEA